MNFKNLVNMLIDNRSKEKGITFVDNPEHNRFVSYNDIFQSAESVLYNLQSHGLKPGNELVFQLNSNIHFVTIFWACLLGKIIPVPITLGENDESRLKLFNIWQTLKQPYLITFRKHLDVLEEFVKNKNLTGLFQHIKHRRTLTVEDMERKEGKGNIVMPQETDTAFVQFSSGSTGDPKGVVLTHKNLLTNINAIIKGLGDPENGIDRYFSWMPLTHDMGLIGFHLTPLAAGWAHTLMSTKLFTRYPHLWLTKISELQSTLTVSPNFGYQYVLKHFDPSRYQGIRLSNLRIILNGAEPISPRLCDEFLKNMVPFGLRNNAISPGYGLAEASLAVTLTHPRDKVIPVHLDRNFLKSGKRVREKEDQRDTNTVSFTVVGSPVQDCSVKIVDKRGNTCGNHVIGEILIKGDNVTSGYYNNSKVTRQAITPDGWLRTGDLGFFRNGQLVITGRDKDIIFVNGQNYYPHDMERVAEELEEIEFEKVAFCSVYNSQLQSDEIACFVVFKRAVNKFLPLVTALKNHILEKVSLEVSKVIPIKKIPKTTSGKIRRYKLKKDYLEGKYDTVLEEIARLDEKITAPGKISCKTSLKELVTEICRDVPNSGTGDDFFNAGFDSLKAISLAARIRHRFNVNVPIGIFFENPTVEGIAQYIRNAKKSLHKTINPAEKKEYYAAAVGQKKLFVLSEMEGIDTTLNIFLIVTLEGPLYKQRFEEAFQALIKRQENFRTSFHSIDGKIVMKIHKTVDFAIEYVQLQENENQENEIQEMIRNFNTPFDLVHPPLLKLKFVKFAKDKHLMLLDIHHIISDDASMGLLLKEVSALYKGEELPVLRVQYKDYAQWLQQFMASNNFKKHESYWLERFSGDIPLLAMPTNYTRPGIQAFDGEWIRFHLEEELVREIERLAEDCRATLYMILLAATNILLSQYTHQEDITIASPVVGRDHEGIENIIGLFINLLPMRNFPEPHKTFSDFLGEVRENALAAYENQAHPFGNLVEKLGIQKGYSRNPLNDVELIMVNTDASLLEIEGLQPTIYEYDMNTTMVDIILEVTELAEKVSFKLMYCTKLFKRETMERFINSFKEILEYVVEDKNILLEDISINTQLSEAKPVFKYNEGDFSF